MSLPIPSLATRRTLPTRQVLTAGLVALAAALTLLPAPLALAAMAGAMVVVATLLRPIIGLYLVVLSVPLQDIGALRVAGTAVTVTKLVVPLALLAWLVLRLARRDARFARSYLVWAYGLYVLTIFGSVITAFDVDLALTEAIRWLQAFAVFAMALDLVRTRRELAGLVAVLLAGGLGQAILGLVQSRLGLGPVSFAIGNGLSRAYGSFGMPNSYAGYLEMSLPITLALCVWLVVRIWRTAFPSDKADAGWPPFDLPATALLLAAGGTVLITGVAVLASFSRGAWLGLAVAGVAMVVVAGRKSILIGGLAALLAGSVLAVGGTALFPATVTDRLDSLVESLSYRNVREMYVTKENWAVAERLAMWEAGLEMFRANPVAGVGAGNYTATYEQYRVPYFIHSQGHAHNYYIHAAAETGIIGLGAYLLALLAAWTDLARGLHRQRDSWLVALCVGAAGVLAAVMTHNVFENLHVLNLNLQFFLVLALPSLARRVAAGTASDAVALEVR